MSDADPTPRRFGATPEAFAMAATLEVTTTFTAAGELVRAGLPSLDRPLGVGEVVGDRYEIRRLLGHGGCGYVYAVHDRELEVDVALKTLRPDLRLAPEAIAQLKREIQLARRVTHANVCRIFDVGFHDDGGRSVPFLTMEKIDGPSLADRLLDEGTLAIDELEALTRQLVAGLQAAHRAGVIHADLKPGNIMLAGAGAETRAVITDFGLATAQSIDLAPEGYVLGTPAYMAPEQVEGKALSPATDYYALGCTLYHAVTGDVPFREKGAFATAAARLERDPQPPRERVELSRKWDEIIMGLLARAPDERLDGARLLRILDPPRRGLGHLSLLLVAALGVALLAAALLWRGDKEPASPLELSMPGDPVAAAKLVEAERLLAAGSSAAALVRLEAALERSPRHPRIHAALAVAYDFYQPARANRLLRRAAELARDHGRDEQAYYEALVMLDNAELSKAVALLTELNVRHPDTFAIERNLARAQHKLGALDLAREILAQLEPPDLDRQLAVLWSRASLEIEARNFAEGQRLAGELRERAREAQRPTAQARAEILLAQSLRQLGEIDRSGDSAERALEAARRAGDPWLIAEAHSTLIAILMARHRYARALESIAGREAALEKIGLAHEITKLGITRAEILAETGRTAEALDLLDETILPALRRRGSVYWEGYAQLVRAQLRRTRGEPGRALDDCRAGHVIFRGIGNQRLAAFAQTVCASVLIDAGALDEAAAALEEAVEIRRGLGLAVLVAQNRVDRGELALARGDLDTAAAEALAAAEFFAKGRLSNNEAAALELVARARWRAGDRDGARAAITRARERLEGEGVPLDQAIAITRLLVEAKPDAGEQLASRIDRLADGGYHALAIEARLARARIERDRGDRDAAATLEAEAAAEASRRGLRPYRYAQITSGRSPAR